MADPAAEQAAISGLAFDAAPVAGLAVDRDGRIVLVNLELERQFGYSRDDLIGTSVDALIPGATEILTRSRRESSVQPPDDDCSGGPALRGRRKDGSEFPLEIAVNPAHAAAGPFAVASITDLTERQRAEAEQRAALEERLAFERAIAALSSQLINVPAEQIDDVIRQGLVLAGEVVQVDRAGLIRLGPEGALRSSVVWAMPEVEPVDVSLLVSDRLPWTFEQLLSGEPVSFASVEEVPDEIDRKCYAAIGTRSLVALPMSVEGRVTAFIGFATIRSERAWSAGVRHRLNVIASVFAQVVARQQRDDALQAAMEETQRLKNQLHVENVFLRTEARDRLAPAEIVGRSPALRQVLAQAEQVASTDSTVLLLGETGTGKELFASHIHSLGARRGRPMVRVNCAAIPATLIESELFGREKGAFTGALARQVGRFELADHSTIFLDEIGDLPLDVQVKLLRVLEERKFERLGSPRPISVDTRIIAATHRNLEQRVAEGAFREDLYYRLNVFPIQVPPLRDRAEDIPLLVQRLVDEFSRTFGKRIETIERDTIAALQRYSWPGNIREL
ncbi:MAG TPA: sigma 54-interacting transcriptional regulator, partial [Vicinamibacterales bacterium]|nr:sigma 54-interacting transcriptional regulator [Vicinamibacterales bacterium]